MLEETAMNEKVTFVLIKDEGDIQVKVIQKKEDENNEN